MPSMYQPGPLEENDPGDPPSLVLDFLLEAAFSPALTARELYQAQREVYRRITKALRPEAFAGLPIKGEVDVGITPSKRGIADAPVFPLQIGGLEFTHAVNVANYLEHVGHETPLGNVGYDATGRAYELGVEIRYIRLPRMDRTDVEDGDDLEVMLDSHPDAEPEDHDVATFFPLSRTPAADR